MHLPKPLLRCLLIAAAVPAMAAPVAAASPVLTLPVDCRIGKTCWVARYMAHRRDARVQDYRCGPQTADPHKGTDIAIRDFKALTSGVRVLAAAAGKVARVRDGMADGGSKGKERPADGSRDCGNGVLIDHGDGWTTQYCHLRRGSIVVRPGDVVVAGQPMGFVGYSGWTNYPHLHMTVRHRGRPVDPFVGMQGGEACEAGRRPLWSSEVMATLPYEEFTIFNAGIAGARPDPELMTSGAYRGSPLPADAPSLNVWVQALWLSRGDVVRFRIRGPAGRLLFDRKRVIERSRVRNWLFAGIARRGPSPWRSGEYRGEVVIRRSTAGRLETQTARTLRQIR